MRRKLGFARPDLSEQHVIVQLSEFWGERAEMVSPCGLFLGHYLLLIGMGLQAV